MEQATGEDNINASTEKAEDENKEGDIVTSPLYRTDSRSIHLGKEILLANKKAFQMLPVYILVIVTDWVAKAPGRTASAGPESAGTDEPVKKDETTQDPEGESDTKKKLDKVNEDK
jgi:hypothetical protein